MRREISIKVCVLGRVIEWLFKWRSDVLYCGCCEVEIEEVLVILIKSEEVSVRVKIVNIGKRE